MRYLQTIGAMMCAYGVLAWFGSLRHDAQFPRWALVLGGILILAWSAVKRREGGYVLAIVGLPFILKPVVPNGLEGQTWLLCGVAVLLLARRARWHS